MNTINEVKDYIRQVMIGFTGDLADSDYLEGFLTAFLDLAAELGMTDDASVLVAAMANGLERKETVADGRFEREQVG